MSKQQSSKLDPFAERIEKWLTPKGDGGDGLTLWQACDELEKDGCSVQASTLSRWWDKRQSNQSQERILDLVTDASRQCKEVDEAFAKNPEPKLEGLIKLIKTLIFQLTSKGAAQPELLGLANNLTNTVCNFLSAQTKAAHKERELALSEQKYAETKKDDQAKALELCLEEARAFPHVVSMFEKAFAELKRAKLPLAPLPPDVP